MKQFDLKYYLAQFVAVCWLAVTFASCGFETEGVYVDDTMEPVELGDYYIDEYGNEGVVVYVKSSVWKYAIVLSSDETCLPWGPMGERVYAVDTVAKNTLSEASYGVAMLQSMKSKGIERYPAQAWCDKKNHGEEFPYGGSWRLPTFHEYVIIMGDNGSRVSSINNLLRQMGGMPLRTGDYYWLCDEDYEGHVKIKDKETDYDCENRAVIVTPMRSSTSTKERWIKKNSHYVRAIKYIYYEY